jgi:hypothetical protein
MERLMGSLVFLRQAEQSGAKTDDIGATRLKQAWVAQPDQGPVAPGIVLASLAHSCASSSQIASYAKIFMLEKQFEFQKV